MNDRAKLTLDSFPIQGRVGRATEGPSAGEFIFVFPEIDGRWGFYVSDGSDDILPSAELAEEWLEEAHVEWLDEGAEREVEARLFQLRPIVESQYDDPGGRGSRLRRWLRRSASMTTEEKIQRWEDRLRSGQNDARG